MSKRTLKLRDFALGDLILYRILLVLLYATGTRRAEAARIRVEDIETLADPQPSSHSDLQRKVEQSRRLLPSDRAKMRYCGTAPAVFARESRKLDSLRLSQN